MRYKSICDIKLPGVYILWRNNKVIYVGQSNYLIRRIKSHNHRWFDEFSFEVIEDTEQRAIREKELIDKHNPLLNKINTKKPVPMYGTYRNRERRWKCERELIKKYGIANLSSRVLTRLLKDRYGIEVNHCTVNADLRKFYTELKNKV